MTILDRPDEVTALDRRRLTSGPRLSWASDQPYLTRPALVPDHPLDWRVVSRSYVRTAALLDALAGALPALAAALVLGLRGERLAWVVAAPVVFQAAVLTMRGYHRRAVGEGPAEFQAVLRAGIVAIAVLAVASVTLASPLPRLGTALTLAGATVNAAVGRYLLRRSLHARRSRGEALARTLVVGDPDSVARVVSDLRASPYHGFGVVGVCLPSILDDSPVPDAPMLGALADIPQVAHDHRADAVIVTGGELAGDALRRLSWALTRTGTDLVVAPGLVEVLGPRVRLHPAAGLSLIEVETTVPRRRLLAKSALDRVIGGLLLLAAAPVIALAWLAVRVSSPGAAFYRQRRIGVDGREFTMWKLRSMYRDAEARRAALLSGSDRDGPMFKMRSDPRITPVGRFLRRYSVDELPQLWNVVRGDMSLVGPRPPLPEEVDTYHDAVNRRLCVRPGLTGLWQVSGRADLSWDESIRLDLRYVDNWSVALDLLILWKTGRAVLGASGAY